MIQFPFKATKHIPCVSSLTRREVQTDCNKNLKGEIERIFEDLEEANGFTLSNVYPQCYSPELEVNVCTEECREKEGGDKSDSDKNGEDEQADSTTRGMR